MGWVCLAVVIISFPSLVSQISLWSYWTDCSLAPLRCFVLKMLARTIFWLNSFLNISNNIKGVRGKEQTCWLLMKKAVHFHSIPNSLITVVRSLLLSFHTCMLSGCLQNAHGWLWATYQGSLHQWHPDQFAVGPNKLVVFIFNMVWGNLQGAA